MLLRSPNLRAARQRGPTRSVSTFMGSSDVFESALCDQEPLMEGRGPPSPRNGIRKTLFRPPRRRPSKRRRFMASRHVFENQVCAHAPGVAPAVPAGREHGFGNPVRGSHGVTSPAFRFLETEIRQPLLNNHRSRHFSQACQRSSLSPKERAGARKILANESQTL